MKLTLTGCLFPRETNRFSMPVKNPNFAINGALPVAGQGPSFENAAIVVGAQMTDGRLAALIGMLRPKSRIASIPANVWRAIQVWNTIDNMWESKC